MNFSYYGLSLDVSGLGLDLYQTQLLFGAVELPSKLLVYLAVRHAGRRLTQAGTLLGTALALGIRLLLTSGEPRHALPFPATRRPRPHPRVRPHSRPRPQKATPTDPSRGPAPEAPPIQRASRSPGGHAHSPGHAHQKGHAHQSIKRGPAQHTSLQGPNPTSTCLPANREAPPTGHSHRFTPRPQRRPAHECA